MLIGTGVMVLAKGDSLEESAYPGGKPPTYSRFYDTLAEALAGRGEVPVLATDARNAIKIIELANQSSREGRTIPVAAGDFA